MKLKEILAISGQSGLYKFVAQSKNGIIVRSGRSKSKKQREEPMKVLKFGGSSVGSAEGLSQVKKVVGACTEDAIVVVSALGGITENDHR